MGQTVHPGETHAFANISIMRTANSLIGATTDATLGWTVAGLTTSANRVFTSAADGVSNERFQTLIYDLINYGILPRR